MKAIKGVFRAVKKVVKKVASSKLGKALLIGATIWVGGAALGAWNLPSAVPFASKINGAFASGAGSGAGAKAATDVAASTGSGGSTSLLNTAARSAPTGVPSMTVTPGATTAVNPAVAGGTAGTVAGATSSAPAPGTAEAIAADSAGYVDQMLSAPAVKRPESILSKFMRGAGEFGSWATAPKNQMLTAMAITGIGGALSPDEMDLMQMQRDQAEEDRLRREGNLDVSRIDVGRVSDKPLEFVGTNKPVFNNGILNRTAARG